MSVRGFRLVAACAAALVVAPWMALSSASATGNGVWEVSVPPEAASNPGASVEGEAINVEAPAGSVTTTFFTASNPGREPLTLSVEATTGIADPPGSRPDPDGEPFPEPDTTSWVAVTEDQVTIPAQGTSEIPLTLRIPSGTPAGDYIAGVLTSAPGPVNPLTETQQTLGLQVLLNIRVSGSITDRLEASSLDVAGASVRFSVSNTGNSNLDPEVTVEGVSTEGAPLTASQSLGLIRPGVTRTVAIQLTAPVASLVIRIAAGTASVEESWPVDPVDALVVPPGATIPPPPDQGDPTAVVLVFAAVLGFIGLILLLAMRKRRRNRRALLARRRAAAAAAAAAAAPPPILDPTPPPGFALLDPEASTVAALPEHTRVTGAGSRTIVTARP
jgi:hypothetical protein